MTSASGRNILDAKLALEQEIARPLLTVCTRYVEAWAEAQGQMLGHDRLDWQKPLEAVLRRHYARVVMVMTGRRPPKDPPLHVAAQTLRQLDSLWARAHEQATLILRSIDRDLMQGLVIGNPISADDGISGPYKGDVALLETKEEVRNVRAGYVGKIKESALSTLRKLKSRVSTIANVQTNSVAEEARIEVVPEDQKNGRIVKRWMSLMDGREREAHHDAHEQEVAVTEAFDVGGEQLRFPGDTALGASLGNVVNCRCYLEHYFISDADGSRTLINVGPSAPTRRFRSPTDGKPPVMRPTSVVTLNGNTRARIVLGDGETFATLRQPSPSTVEVLVNRRVIGRASIVNGRAVNVSVDPNYGNQDVDGLIRRSVEHSTARQR